MSTTPHIQAQSGTNKFTHALLVLSYWCAFLEVTTPGCIQNSASIASGNQYLTNPEFTFGESNLVDNMCEQQVELTFDPVEEFADEISIQFTSRNHSF